MAKTANFFDRLLIDYLPPVIKDVREYEVIMSAEQPEVFGLFGKIQNALNNQFIMFLDEYGVSRWEKIIGIHPKATYTLEERIFTILTMLAKRLPYTHRMLEIILTELCGTGNFEINLNYNAYTLLIDIEIGSVSSIDDVERMLRRIIPANLITTLRSVITRDYTAFDYDAGATTEYIEEVFTE